MRRRGNMTPDEIFMGHRVELSHLDNQKSIITWKSRLREPQNMEKVKQAVIKLREELETRATKVHKLVELARTRKQK